MQSKTHTTIESLCRGSPNEFLTYMNYCRSLRFEDKPDISFLKQTLKDLFYRENYEYDFVYDWNVLNTNLISTKNPHTEEADINPTP